MTLVIAHSGHWLPQLLYLAPLVVVVFAIARGRWSERHSDDTPTADEQPPPD